MEKTLDATAVLYRLIMGIALVLLVVGCSLHHPSAVYNEAISELKTLEDAIDEISDQIDSNYAIIYDSSELRLSALAWLRQRNAAQRTINVNIVLADELRVPGANQNAFVTLNDQVKWVDLFREQDYPFLLCAVQRREIFRALDSLLDFSTKLKLRQLNVYLGSSHSGSAMNAQYRCTVDLQYEARVGMFTVIRSATLDVRTIAVDVIAVGAAGSKWIDFEPQGILKDLGLGDYEDLQSVQIPALRELWTEIGSRPVPATTAFIKQKQQDEEEKAKTKIDILGESLNASLTIIFASIVELCLMVYLLAQVLQVCRALPEQRAPVSESPLFGIMSSLVGKVVMLVSCLLPLGVSIFVLFFILPSLTVASPVPQWIVGPIFAWFVVGSLVIIDAMLILKSREIIIKISPEITGP